MAYVSYMSGTRGSFRPVVYGNLELLGFNSCRVKCLSSRLCIDSAPNCSKPWSV